MKTLAANAANFFDLFGENDAGRFDVLLTRHEHQQIAWRMRHMHLGSRGDFKIAQQVRRKASFSKVARGDDFRERLTWMICLTAAAR